MFYAVADGIELVKSVQWRAFVPPRGAGICKRPDDIARPCANARGRSADHQANPIETRRQLVDAEAARPEALGATIVRVLYQDGVDHYGVAMRDPEGNVN